MAKWFQKAVKDKPPYNLGGWRKSLKSTTRRTYALQSRPKNWKLSTRYLSVARALTALANVTQDSRTRVLARSDAKYFYDRYKRTK